MDAKDVSQQAITEAAEVVAEKIDTLLERAADVLLGAPKPGSAQWHQAWAARDTAAGRAALERRARMKIAIAETAGVTLCHGSDDLRRAGVPAQQVATVEHRTQRPPSRSRRGSAASGVLSGSQQLAIW